MNIKSALLAAVGLTLAIGAASGASAETRWGYHHPRQHEVYARLANQDRRIDAERRDGQITRGDAHFLHAQDHRIARQDRFDARVNGGYVTRGQQAHMNREENRVSGDIGR